MSARFCGLAVLLCTGFFFAVPCRAYIKDMTRAQQDSARADRWEHRESWQRPADVLAFSGIQPGDVVADLGAGYGYFTEKIASVVGPQGRVIALDVQKYVLEINERAMAEFGHANVETRLIASDNPGIRPGEADVIFVCKTWHFFPERFCYAKRLAAVMTGDTRLIVVNSGLEAQTVATRRPGTTDRYEVQRQAEAAGMVVENEIVLGRQFLVDLRLGKAPVFQEVDGFRYASSELAVVDRQISDDGLFLLFQRGFRRILDVGGHVDKSVAGRANEVGISYLKVDYSELAMELGGDLEEVTLLIADSSAEAHNALVELVKSGEFILDSCEMDSLVGSRSK